MVRRSVMFSPGDRPELMRKAAKTDADVVVFDLEDAVAPDEKARARRAVGDVLTDPSFDPPAEVVVRVNAGATARTDLEALPPEARFDAVMVPKVGRLDDVLRVERYLDDLGLERPSFALVESATGVLNAPAVAAANPVDALVFGAEDLAADLRAERTPAGTEVLYARERVVLAARAGGVDAIDTLHTDFTDSDGLREDAAFARQLGYDGKLAIHPDQVPVINEAFTPDPERVEWARRVLAARDEAASAGRGVFQIDGEMIDAPLITQAERVVELAEAAGDSE